MTGIFLRKKITDRIGAGHPWVFDNEIGEVKGTFQPGSIANVFSSNGAFVGRGYFNPHSKIRVRLLTRKVGEQIDSAFFSKRIEKAISLRRQVGMSGSYRLVAAEADYLPGLIVDRYQDGLVFQTLTLGMDKWKAQIVKVLIDLLQPTFIVERNDATVRFREGLSLEKRVVYGTLPSGFSLEWKGLKWLPNLLDGPNTGMHWEQFRLGKALANLSSGCRVLDAFCHYGLIGLTAAAAGASEVLGIDQDQAAVDQAAAHASLNGMSKPCTYIKGNVFDLLKTMDKTQPAWDIVVLNPPSLIKGRVALESGINGYRELNLRAMRLLSKGGFLVTTFNSYLLGESMIMEIFNQISRDVKRNWRLITRVQMGPDHPVLGNIPQTDAFKGFILQVD